MEQRCPKFNLYMYVECEGLGKKRFVGSLGCRSDDLLQAGVALRGELVIKVSDSNFERGQLALS